MIQALLNRLRVERARQQVAAFEPACEEQARLRLLVISLIDFVGLVQCQPGREQDFQDAWERIDYFRELMKRPPMGH